MSAPSFVRFDQGVSGGAVAITIFAVLSTLALASVAVRIIWIAVRQFITHNYTQPQEYVFFHTQLGHYAACLLISNLLSSIAGLITINWVSQRGITQDSACLAQATIAQFSNWAAGYFTVTIAVHTFNSLVLRVRQSVLVCVVTITTGWFLSLSMALVPFILSKQDGLMYGADGFSCGVRHAFPQDEFFFHLLPIFIASILSAILYSIVFLVLRGTLVIRGGLKLTLDPQERWSAGGVSANYHRFVARIARSMLWYPIAYIALLIPYSVTRMLIISGFTIPFEAKVFASTCWYLLGIVDVMLLYNTFRVLGPAFDARSTPARSNDTESSGTMKKMGKYEARSSISQASLQSSLTEKIDQYRDLSYNAPTVRNVPAAHLAVGTGQAAAVQSFYSYPSSPSVGRKLSNSQRQSPPSSEGLTINHSRQNSMNAVGLPAPPRPSRSPIKRYPTLERLHDRAQVGAWSEVDLDGDFTPSALSNQNLSRSPRNSIMVEGAHVKNFSRSSSSSEGGCQPAISAVNSSFGPSPLSTSPPPLPTRSASASAAIPVIGSAPVGRHRTVLANRPSADLGHNARVPSFSAPANRFD
ncbi:hypothetical protein BDN72DRAFT_894414 [Pluteus cervinus]|uniref:Uncharacterized protein n=1 Tax=Pluteus cervinus TaxID=181527 RepID=A0ACD3B5P4_9AGAR|nr:hypothetical protein BDN72DRAFT_894414 [Pluteus cervinus]